MKAALPLLFLLLGVLAARADINFREVSFTRGPSAFHEGDAIEIDEVYATDDDFEQRDQVVVRGHYRLESHDAANLSLYVTQTGGDDQAPFQPTQQLVVERGSGPFELRMIMPADGYLHVTFYTGREQDGKTYPFGGVYFGTRAQMAQISSWDLGYYLQDKPTGRHSTPGHDYHLRPVSFTAGPRAFLPGDFIEVESVEGTDSDFEEGDRVLVRGRYRLESREAANILLTVTQSGRGKRVPLEPEQQLNVKRGSGLFELSLEMPADGYLHLGFYPPEGGKGCGSAYIGTEDQMAAIKDWRLEARLK